MKYNFVLCLVLCSLIIVSCSKEDLDVQTEQKEQISGSSISFLKKMMVGYELLGGEINTVVGIESSKIGADGVSSYNQHIHALKEDAGRTDFLLNDVDVAFDKNTTENTIVNGDFFGKTISFEKKSNSASERNRAEVTRELYCPMEIDLIRPTGADARISTGESSLRRSQRIEWNADLRNTNGVVIRVSYDAGSVMNRRLNSRPSSSHEYAVLTEDDGSKMINIPAEIPTGAHVFVTIVRGNAEILNERLADSNVNKYGTYCYTQACNWYYLR